MRNRIIEGKKRNNVLRPNNSEAIEGERIFRGSKYNVTGSPNSQCAGSAAQEKRILKRKSYESARVSSNNTNIKRWRVKRL